MDNKYYLEADRKGNPLPVVGLCDSHDIDGTSASAKSNVISGTLVRIVSTGSPLRVVSGEDPVATGASIYIAPYNELWLPVVTGHKVAVLGGNANICTACNIG